MEKALVRAWAFTTPARDFPFTMSTNWMAISSPQRLWASLVLAPRWGQLMTRSCSTKARSRGGSSVNTSSAAPAHWPERRARSRAPSSTIPPRAQFTTRTPFLHWAKVLSFSRPVVEGSRGVCTVIKSQRGQISSRGSCWTPKEAETSGAMMGSYPTVFIPKDCIRVATSLPILPRPRIPRIFPFSSVPMNFFLSHLPSFMEAVAWGCAWPGT